MVDTPKEYKFLHESQEVLRKLVMQWKQEHDKRWDKHDERSEKSWDLIRIELANIKKEVINKPCEVHAERVTGIENNLNVVMRFVWFIVISLLGTLGAIFLKIMMSHLNSG